MATRKGPIKVLHYGLGPIGAAVVKQVADRRGLLALAERLEAHRADP